MQAERESVLNSGFKNPDVPRLESDKMDTRTIVLERNAYLPFTWYKKLSQRVVGCRFMVGYVLYLVWRI